MASNFYGDVDDEEEEPAFLKKQKQRARNGGNAQPQGDITGEKGSLTKPSLLRSSSRSTAGGMNGQPSVTLDFSANNTQNEGKKVKRPTRRLTNTTADAQVGGSGGDASRSEFRKDNRRKTEHDRKAEALVAGHVNKTSGLIHAMANGDVSTAIDNESNRNRKASTVLPPDPSTLAAARPELRKRSSGGVGRSCFAGMTQSVKAEPVKTEVGSTRRSFGSIARASCAFMKSENSRTALAKVRASMNAEISEEDRAGRAVVPGPAMKAGFLQLLNAMSEENEKKAREAREAAAARSKQQQQQQQQQQRRQNGRRADGVVKFSEGSDREGGEENKEASKALSQFYGDY